MKHFALTLALFIFPILSNALVITIEPDDYAIGTNLTNVSDLVTFKGSYYSQITNGRPEGDSGVWDYAPTGNLVFANVPGTGTSSSCGIFGDGVHSDIDNVLCDPGLAMFFSQEVSHATLLGFNANYPFGLGAIWRAFDKDGNRIGTGQTNSAPVGGTFLVDVRLDGMWTLIVGGWTGIGAIKFDHLTFDTATPVAAVPESGSLGMLAAGLAGLMFFRRRIM